MRPLGWVSHLGPPLLLAAAVGGGSVLLPSTLLAGTGSLARGCPPATTFAQAVGASTRGPALDAELRLATTLNARGEVTGRLLSVNTAAGTRSRSLSAEAFAAPPQANVVVFGQYDPVAGSTIGAFDLQTGCEFSLWASSDVVRSAVIAAGLDSLYVHIVKAGDRVDGGVQRIDMANGGSAAALSPIATDSAYGPTFATLLRWSLDGDALAVQSCGVAACRTRVLELAGSVIEAFGDGAQSQIVGLTSGTLVTFDACPELPCGLAATDRSSGRKVRFDIDAYRATLTEDAEGPLITAETAAGTKEIRP